MHTCLHTEEHTCVRACTHTQTHRHILMPAGTHGQGPHAPPPAHQPHPKWQSLTTLPTGKPPTPGNHPCRSGAGGPERQSQSEKQLLSSRGGSWPAEHKVGAQEKPAEGPKTMFTTDREALCLQLECRGGSQLPQEAGGLASCRRGNRGPRGNGVLSRAPRSAHLLPLALRVCKNSAVLGGCTLARDTPLILDGSPVGWHRGGQGAGTPASARWG